MSGLQTKDGRKRKAGKHAMPQPGDPEYKSSTQLRNARKRRKNRKDKKNRLATNSFDKEDPSLRYLSNPTAAPTVKHAISFFKEHGHEFNVKVGPTKGWRTVVKLACRTQNGVLSIGLFVPGSHTLLEIPQCKVHHSRINDAIEVIQKKCRKHNIKPFDEATGKGSLKYVAINIERATGRQQVTLVWNENETSKEERDKLKGLCDTLIRVSDSSGETRLDLHSLWIHYSKSNKHANSIFDRTGRWERLHGMDAIIEYLDVDESLNVPLNFPPNVFRQANLDAFTHIVSQIRSWIQESKSKRCLELYGGVGTIGLHIVDICESFVSSDENPFNKECFERTVEQLDTRGPARKCTRISYESKNATDMVFESPEINKADLVIVDPPRKGLDPEVVDALCQGNNLKTLIYVSCGFDAFARDFQSLTTRGNWHLKRAEGHVLFPGSDAIETLALFLRP